MTFSKLHLGLLTAVLALGPMTLANAKTPADQLIVGMSMVNLFSIDPANAPGLDASGVNANLYDTLIKRDQGNPENTCHSWPNVGTSARTASR